eukprot:1666345-Pyramimonas_sp.AAC.1
MYPGVTFSSRGLERGVPPPAAAQPPPRRQKFKLICDAQCHGRSESTGNMGNTWARWPTTK